MTATNPPSNTSQTSPEAFAEAIGVAEAVCAAAGSSLTAPRRRVLSALLEAGKPMKAYDLLQRISDGEGQAKPPTVYRALDFLAREGLIHRIETDSTFVVCEHLGQHVHGPECAGHGGPDGAPGHHPSGAPAGFLLCDSCGRSIETSMGAAAEAAKAAAAAAGFVLRRMVLEGRGVCAQCAASGARAGTA